MTPVLAEVGMQLFQAALPAIIAGLAYLGHWLSKLLRAKAHNAAADMALDILDNFVGTAVTRVEQTVAAELKTRSQGGKLTTADAQAVKAKAMEAIRAYYGPAGMDLLAESLKMSRDAVPGLIADKIETKVYQMRFPEQAGLPVFRAGPPTPAPAPAPKA